MNIRPISRGNFSSDMLGSSYGQPPARTRDAFGKRVSGNTHTHQVEPFTDTPLIDSYIRNVQSADTPPCKKVTLALASPIVLPFMAIMDAVLWPVTKCSQLRAWLASKFSG